MAFTKLSELPYPALTEAFELTEMAAERKVDNGISSYCVSFGIHVYVHRIRKVESYEDKTNAYPQIWLAAANAIRIKHGDSCQPLERHP